ncbi:MAG: 50S ribosomal protein L17 [Pseudomonadota bacterium]
MRHRKTGRKLGRDSSHRQAMMRNMVTSFFKHEQLETTDAKAKELRPIAEKMITLAKRGDLHARRQAIAFMKDKATTHRLFEELKNRYLDRQGGYVRIIKKGNRKGDGAPISIVQMLPMDEAKERGRKKGQSMPSRAKTEPSEKREPDAKEGEKNALVTKMGENDVTPDSDAGQKKEN